MGSVLNAVSLFLKYYEDCRDEGERIHRNVCSSCVSFCSNKISRRTHVRTLQPIYIYMYVQDRLLLATQHMKHNIAH